MGSPYAYDFSIERVGVEEAERANYLRAGGPGDLLLFDEEQLILADVLGVQAIGRRVEVLRERGDRVQVKPDGGGGILADLKILQHALSKWGHDELLSPVTTSQFTAHDQPPSASPLFQPPED
jgi:hypothetical protein